MKSDKIEGLQITGFFGQSQLKEKGLQEGDWILEYNNEKVTSKAQLKDLELKYQHLNNIILKVQKVESEEYFQIWPGELGVYLAERMESPKVLSDAKRIEKIERLEKKTGLENTFFGSLVNILRFYKININFNNLVGLSSFQFRIQFDENFSRENLDPTEGFNCAELFFKNHNIKFKQIKKSKNDKIQEEIIVSIDKKIPVLSRNLFGKNEWGIIAGYQKKGEELFCRSYSDKTIDYSIAPQKPNQVIIFENQFKKTQFQENEEQFIKSLDNAKFMLSSKNFGKYFAGNLALEKWQKILENEDFFTKLSDKKVYKIFKNNKLFFNHYSFQFRIAVDYLESIVKLFPESKEHLKRLAKFYRAESKILNDCQKYIPADLDEDLRKFWTQQYRGNEAVALIKIQKKNMEILRIMEKLPLLNY
ncbi:MAG: hypothetical protein H8D22_00845 [Candidatus Cloacimonetes bacterium]|nr:hypothetical protein [Candidatus Cloacimonadota bacterium]